MSAALTSSKKNGLVTYCTSPGVYLHARIGIVYAQIAQDRLVLQYSKGPPQHEKISRKDLGELQRPSLDGTIQLCQPQQLQVPGREGAACRRKAPPPQQRKLHPLLQPDRRAHQARGPPRHPSPSPASASASAVCSEARVPRTDSGRYVSMGISSASPA